MENAVRKVCKECHKVFFITQGELDWLKEKKFMPFERCSDCRKARRDAKHAAKKKGGAKNG